MNPLYSQKKNLPSIRTTLFVLFFVLLLLFAFSRAYNMLYGPRIVIEGPSDGETFSQNLVTIKGTVANAALIHLDGRKIFTDPRGAFTEDILLQAGYNVVTLTARDRFGRDKEVTLHMVYQEKEAPGFSLLPK
jgi:hypothetical protein